MLTEALKEIGYCCEGHSLGKFAVENGLHILPEKTAEWIGSLWGTCDFIFIGAMGIAVRYIAPWIRDKMTDSAVIVMDERGQYVIPVLSGHIGGAVVLAEQLANITGGNCVVTTATDIQKKFAVDMFAVKNKMQISDRELAKRISAAVLNGERIGFYSEYEMVGSCPEELKKVTSSAALDQFLYGIAVLKNYKRKKIIKKENIMCFYPRDIVVGVGCRKGVTKNKIEMQLEAVLKEHGLQKEQIDMIASIDVKKDEPGLVELAESYERAFITYPPDILLKAGPVSSHSVFVEKTVGVDNVCERAALTAGGADGELLLPKTVGEEVTFAIVRKKKRLEY